MVLNDSVREDDVLLHGAYVVTPGDGNDRVAAVHPDGEAVEPVELDTLDAVVGDLVSGDGMRGLLVLTPLRLAETAPIRFEMHEELHGKATESRQTLSLIGATASTASYQIDLAATASVPLLGEIDLKGRHTLVVDRARGRIIDHELVRYKTERKKGRDTESLIKETRRVAFEPAPRGT
jgi:hypothetical protein